ncbi:acyltransferase [Agrobacterium rhizogenes]|uniref:acyltransferase family protein n=1 Tax=Rhizobium rhizogenes TaxID=359 RepID=UPI0022B6B98F|nr:acyltransferase [Rhizobium rhizogenes]MCZ7447478.1 acyltransferase [Rhizobium rhizogenes]
MTVVPTRTQEQHASEQHGDNFAAIRLIAAVLVVFGHSFPLSGGHGPGYLGSPVSTLAVKVFFVISGYLISESWVRDPNVVRYLLRRSLRIFPALIILCLVTVLLVGPTLTVLPVSTYFAKSGTWSYFWNVGLLPNYSLPGMFASNIYPNAVNGSLWTLPVEFLMYLIMPLVLLLPMSRYAVVVAALALSAASVWFTRIHIPDAPPVFWGTNSLNALEMAPYFLWGAAYRLWCKRGQYLNLQVAVLMLLLLPLLATDWLRSEVVALIVVPYLTLAFGHAAQPVFAWLERYGDFSYGAYLYGFLCQQIVAHFLPSANHWLNFFLAVAPTLLLGVLSWKLIEEPALKLKPRQRVRRAEVVAPERATPPFAVQQGVST